MAKMTLNRIVEALWGKLGDLVYRQRPDGTIIVSGTPEQNKKKATQKQKEYRQRFGQRSQYASWLAKQHPIYAELASREEARARWLSPFNFAVSDCAHPPEIHRVERREGRILVEASDNVMVAKVIVTIYDEHNQLLERGDAVPQEGNMWEFACQAEGKTIQAQAWDLANNHTELVV
jgi:C4-dicarboxylate-specific signal transduction histidine kinase